MSRLALLATLVLILAPACFGQAFTASLTGVVEDPNQAVVPGATVHLRNQNTNETRQTSTNEVGRYVFSQLLPGPYELRVEAPGFKSFTQTDIVLRANQQAEVNPRLQLGEVTETVQVAATTLLLETQSANQSVTMTTDRILNLPSSIRNPFVVVHSLAGVTSMSVGNSQNISDQNINRFAFNGGRDMSGLVLIDGVPATAGDWGGLLATPSIESVNEVQVARNSYDAEFGKSGGGVVSLVTKGGSNDFHGNAFEFLRNDNLDANTWANNRAGRPLPEFKRHQFGGSFSGPLWRQKKLYFLGTYEALKEGSPSTTTTTVPTTLEREGDFSQTRNPNGTLSLIYDPFSTRPAPDGRGQIRDPFPGNAVPRSRWDTVGANVVKLYPLPNTTPSNPVTQANNFFGSGVSKVDNHRMDLRIDWPANEKFTVYGRVTKAWQARVTPRFFKTGADTGNEGEQPRYHATIGFTVVPSPVWVINTTIGSGRWREEQLPVALRDGVLATAIGLPQSLVNALDSPHLPQFAISGYSGLSSGRVLNFPRQTDNLQANITREIGVHSLKFGFTGELARLNSIDIRSADFAFDRGMTSGPVAAISSATSGNSIASLLLGTGIGAAATGAIGGVTAANNAVVNRVQPATMQRYYGLYIQDVWRLNRRLTINAGLRYEIQRPRTERFNRYNYFDFTAANPLSQRTGLNLRGGLVFVNEGNRGQTQQDWTDFAPRIGIAYKITERLVARAGYGIFYLQTVGNALQGGPAAGTDGFTVTTEWITSRGGDGLIPNDLLSNPYPNGLNRPIGSSQGLLTQTGSTVVAWQYRNPTGYTQNYSFDLQFDVGRGAMFEIGYSGNVGRKLNVGGLPNANQLHPQYLSLGADLDRQVPNPFFGVFATGVLSTPTVPYHRLLRPHPHFSSVEMTGDTPGASSSFNALFLKFNKPFSGGLSLLTSYQFSKAIDDASENQGWIINERFRDFYDRRADRSISGHDVPHSFVTALVYELPVGKGRKIGAAMHPALEAVAGGWDLSGVIRFASGLPFRLEAQNTLATYGFSILYPNVADSNALSVDKRVPERWFNTAAVSQPAPFTLGNAPRFLANLRADGTHHADVNIAKNFHLIERVRMQFRAEFFNITNTPQFSPPGGTVGTAAFGQVSGTRFSDRRNIQLGLKLMF
jgi:hypothetical protein